MSVCSDLLMAIWFMAWQQCGTNTLRDSAGWHCEQKLQLKVKKKSKKSLFWCKKDSPWLPLCTCQPPFSQTLVSQRCWWWQSWTPSLGPPVETIWHVSRVYKKNWAQQRLKASKWNVNLKDVQRALCEDGAKGGRQSKLHQTLQMSHFLCFCFLSCLLQCAAVNQGKTPKMIKKKSYCEKSLGF